MRTKTLTISAPCCGKDMEVRFTPEQGGCRTQRNGDPGWPDDPAEVEYEPICNACGKDLDARGLLVDLVMERASEKYEALEEQAREP